jgi:protein PET117
MSRASQLTLATTCFGAIAIVAAVHYGQKTEKAVGLSHTNTTYSPSNTAQAMHAGVIRDYEQQRLKRERQADFEMQRALEEEYRKVQTVSDGGGPAAQQVWNTPPCVTGREGADREAGCLRPAACPATPPDHCWVRRHSLAVGLHSPIAVVTTTPAIRLWRATTNDDAKSRISTTSITDRDMDCAGSLGRRRYCY